jgi:hypothetical protein
MLPTTSAVRPAWDAIRRAVHDFSATMMGNILIKHPRDDIEKRG